MLPLSHDEVVHGKGSLLAKMPGDPWQKYATLRLLYGYQWALPGKKLLFMGDEIGVWNEWNHDDQLDWAVGQHPAHAGIARWVGDLNGAYRKYPRAPRARLRSGRVRVDRRRRSRGRRDRIRAHRCARRSAGDRRGQHHTGPARGLSARRVATGFWREILNSDATVYGGSGMGNTVACMRRPMARTAAMHSIVITVPPLGVVMFIAE